MGVCLPFTSLRDRELPGTRFGSCRVVQSSRFDLLGRDGKRYQVKRRGCDVLNVDVNNFDFDFFVLLNLSDDYALKGIWRLPVDAAQKLFVFRERFRKFQAAQKSVKANAEPLGLKSVTS
jgi:hypothetical protein